MANDEEIIFWTPHRFSKRNSTLVSNSSSIPCNFRSDSVGELPYYLPKCGNGGRGGSSTRIAMAKSRRTAPHLLPLAYIFIHIHKHTHTNMAVTHAHIHDLAPHDNFINTSEFDMATPQVRQSLRCRCRQVAESGQPARICVIGRVRGEGVCGYGVVGGTGWRRLEGRRWGKGTELKWLCSTSVETPRRSPSPQPPVPPPRTHLTHHWRQLP